jgi:hypothetical protein
MPAALRLQLVLGRGGTDRDPETRESTDSSFLPRCEVASAREGDETDCFELVERVRVGLAGRVDRRAIGPSSSRTRLACR